MNFKEQHQLALGKRHIVGTAAFTLLAGVSFGIIEVLKSKPQDEALSRLWAFEGELPQGGKMSLNGLRGKPLLINFWATWCPPCVEELPLIEAFYQENKPKSWQVIGLAADNIKNVTKFLGQNPLNFPTPLAGLEGIELSRALGNLSGALPFSVVINAKGEIALRHMGKLSAAQLKEIAKIHSSA